MSAYSTIGDPLTSREEHVLYALADGLTNHEIGDELHITTSTVHEYTKSMFVKLGARNRTHAVALAYHHGLLIPMREVAEV